jgi:DNA-binding CsgD family transcriptional regulator
VAPGRSLGDVVAIMRMSLMTMTRLPSSGLVGRRGECESLDRLLASVRAGQGRVLVVRGEAGIGKTALLDYLTKAASGFRVARAAGVESEMELAFAGLHQLCAPMLGHLERLPGPQRDALRVAFGLQDGGVPDQFLVALAALSLLAEVAEASPLVCVVDDVQWLDQASTLTLTFVARRLLAERIALVFAVREGSEPGAALDGLPQLVVRPLGDADARRLLAAGMPGLVDERARDQIIAETRGNPLALMELPRGLTSTALAGGFGLPARMPLASRVEAGFIRRLEPLPAETRRLLLAAAIEPVGDVTLLRRVAERLGLAPEAAGPAEEAGLVEMGVRFRFRHPLVRSAVYRAASLPDRREAHRALADATDAAMDPDRRAWHRAQAAPDPDEEVAMELERSADRARSRGGVAAAAAFLQRAAALTPDPARRAQRALEAAQCHLHAGAFEPAAELLAMAHAAPVDELNRARVDLLHAEIAFAQNLGSEAPAPLLAAARRLERLDVALARETYLEALSAAIFAGHLARGPGLREVAEAARRAPPAPPPARVPDKLLDALAARFTDGHSAAVPVVARAVQAFCDEAASDHEAMRWLWLASTCPSDLWDHERWYALACRHVTIAREAGALSQLPLALHSCVFVHVFAGELAVAASLAEEATTVSEATGSKLAPYGALAVAALRGREREARTLIDATMSEAASRGEGIGVTMAHWANALLCNGLGEHGDALTSSQEAARHPQELTVPRWALAELVESAAHTGADQAASEALERLSEAARACGTDWALGVEARSHALMTAGEAAERLYREAIERLARTRVRVELARAHLVYGEWLQRERRRSDAREHLHTAHEMFARIGAEAFAERARRELLATGETVHQRYVKSFDELTPQEAQIARLAAEGQTNPEIGAKLFISPRTVEFHLHKVFAKLGISSRKELGGALQRAERAPAPA